MQTLILNPNCATARQSLAGRGVVRFLSSVEVCLLFGWSRFGNRFCSLRSAALLQLLLTARAHMFRRSSRVSCRVFLVQIKYTAAFAGGLFDQLVHVADSERWVRFPRVAHFAVCSLYGGERASARSGNLRLCR